MTDIVQDKIIHGKNCKKQVHLWPGYAHSEDDDSPYDVDGVSYCGRCHLVMPINPQIIHGKTCCKEIHRAGRTGYFHGPEDDGAYYVEINGPMYCGRCHEVLP